MGLRCQIKYRKGDANVFNEDGSLSVLYADALALTKNQGEALNIWATASLKEFELISGKINKNDEVSLSEVLEFYNSQKIVESKLSPAEKFEIEQFMKTAGFTRLSELRDTLNGIFRPGGDMLVTSVFSDTSGLYGPQELRELDLNQINTILNKIDNQLLTEDIVVELDEPAEKFKNSDYKTIFGTYEIIPQEVLDNSIEQVMFDFTEEEFYNKIQELPYPSFVENFYSDRQFALNVIEKFKGIKKLPVLEFHGDNLVQAITSTYSTVKNTLLSDFSSEEIAAELDYLKSIDIDLWLDSADEIQSVLGELEETLIKSNIDVIGIKKLYKNREDVINLLDSMTSMLVNPSEETIVEFSRLHDVLIVKPEYRITEKLPDNYQDLNIVKVYSNRSDDYLFETHGLLKISTNIYHKIDRSGLKSDLYEYLYQELVNDRLAIPEEILSVLDYKNIENKPAVLEGISQFVNMRDSRIISQFQEEISLYQLIFKHQPISEPAVKGIVSSLTQITTDEDYLKTDFVSDFYNYTLEEKLRDSLVYRQSLSKFRITDQDIVLVSPIETIENLKFASELSDYIRLKKNSDMAYLINTVDSVVLDDLLYLNMPELAPEITENFSKDGDYLISEPSESLFVKTGGKLYRKALENDNVNLYLVIKTPANPLYYTVNTNFSFDVSAAQAVLNRYSSLNVVETVDVVQDDEFIQNIRANENEAEFLVNAETIIDSNLKIAVLYSEEQVDDILTKINNCE